MRERPQYCGCFGRYGDDSCYDPNCSQCHGTGVVDGSFTSCENCGGEGVTKPDGTKFENLPENHVHGIREWTICGKCFGYGEIEDRQ